MSRKRSQGSRNGRPAPETPALIDLRVLFVAALVASPAAYRFSQGLLSVDEALTRFLLVALACTAALGLVRAVWPLIAGPSAPVVEPGTGHLESAAADSAPAAETSISRPTE